MDVNFFGAVALTQKLLPLIRRSQGRVINISSLAGLTCGGGGTIYSSSKYALEAFTDGLRKEMRPLGVAVVSINPGFIKTPILDKVVASFDSYAHVLDDPVGNLYQRYYSEHPQRLLLTFQAEAVTTAATDEAIMNAALQARPNSRYYPGAVRVIPAPVVAVLAHVLPTYLMDAIAEG